MIKNNKKVTRIKIQSKFSFNTYILLVLSPILIVSFYDFLITNKVYWHSLYIVWFFLSFILVAIPAYLANKKISKEYVSEMIISEDSLTLIYKKGRTLRYKNIPLNTINEFDVNLLANNLIFNSGGRGTGCIIFDCQTFISINTDAETIKFEHIPLTLGITLHCTELMLKLLKISKLIPNFSYKVSGNSKIIKTAINYYATHNKKIPFFTLQKIYFQSFSSWGKFNRIMLYLILMLMFILTVLLIFFQFSF